MTQPRPLRTADFLAQDLWEAKGLLLHGHEVKVSRSDWLIPATFRGALLRAVAKTAARKSA